MILVALFIGIILVVASIRGTQGDLFTALGTDIPAYVVWAAAIIALGAIGWIPGLKPISRGLLALVIVVIILRNYQAIITGFKAVAVAPSTATATNTSSTNTNTVASSATSASSVTEPGTEHLYLTVPALGTSSSNSFGSSSGVLPGE